MTEFRKGDICSLEVEVSKVYDDGFVRIVVDYGDHGYALSTHPSNLTLIRRAPVDLATCDLPVEVVDDDGDVGQLVARHDGWGWVQYNNAPCGVPANNTLPLSDLRHEDAGALIAPTKREGV